MNRRFLLIATAILCMLLCGCSILDDEVPKSKIIAYVTDHAAELESFPYKEMPGNDSEAEAYIKEHLGIDTIVKDVYRSSSDILKFYCGGTGIVTSSTYSGFYYSKDDIPYAFEFSKEAVFVQNGEKYEWKSDDGQRQFLTERIQPYWFYYYMVWN